MKKYISSLFIGLAFLLTGCDKDHDNTPKPLPPGEERTVLAYWVADNKPGNDLSSYAIRDFNEMVEGMANVDVEKNNLLVYIETRYDVPRLIRVTKLNDKIVADTIITYPEQNPLDKEIMKGVINRVVTDYPAKSYGLILASHAEGWIEASNVSTRHWGDYRGTNMNIPDLRDAVMSFPHLDFILFDACYMQAIEVLYELKDCADYIIASPTEIPGPGAPYQKVIPAMFANSENYAENIGRAYYEYYGRDNGEIINTPEWTFGVSISVVKTSELEMLAEITRSIISNNVSEGELVSVSSLFYYGYTNTPRYYYYDLEKFIAQQTEKDANYEAWKEQLDKTQIYFRTTKTNLVNRIGGSWNMAGAAGISMYVPKDQGDVHAYYKTLKWYEASGWKNVGW
ncbi:clostripain-related cysteine peptidase [Bacteroides sp. 224]|uniref:clostripain-related cysteine peptidase n=1 Tax=Bacteroides sp. 224 TaxID=2302936 RepID=UPI0013D149BD|nr:clostripain-related cysteine peptidase [Bacteroides sp. 224]NDV66969.1 hypothetical protein [Bacteroides sp. 224]